MSLAKGFVGGGGVVRQWSSLGQRAIHRSDGWFDFLSACSSRGESATGDGQEDEGEGGGLRRRRGRGRRRRRWGRGGMRRRRETGEEEEEEGVGGGVCGGRVGRVTRLKGWRRDIKSNMCEQYPQSKCTHASQCAVKAFYSITNLFPHVT